MVRLFCLCLFVFSCVDSKVKHQAVFLSHSNKMLLKKHQLYLDLSVQKKDSFGWISDSKCDGLLFNSLYSLSGGSVDLEKASGRPGGWFRHPSKNCYKTKGSASTISRDMLLGLFLWIWKNKRLDLIESIIHFGEKNRDSLGNWTMGHGDVFRVSVTPSLRALACEVSYKLGGPPRSFCRSFVHIYGPCSGYRCHLQALRIHLKGQLFGGLTQRELRRIKIIRQSSPRNALFEAIHARYTNGDMTRATSLLMDKKLFPDDRLPGSLDRCSFYLFERDEIVSGKPNRDWIKAGKKGLQNRIIHLLYHFKHKVSFYGLF